jgi:hypothetical protein
MGLRPKDHLISFEAGVTVTTAHSAESSAAAPLLPTTGHAGPPHRCEPPAILFSAAGSPDH